MKTKQAGGWIIEGHAGGQWDRAAAGDAEPFGSRVDATAALRDMCARNGYDPGRFRVVEADAPTYLAPVVRALDLDERRGRLRYEGREAWLADDESAGAIVAVHDALDAAHVREDRDITTDDEPTYDATGAALVGFRW